MKINFSNLKILTISGEVDKTYPDLFYKDVANHLYKKAATLDQIELARKINSGKDEEFSESEITNLKEFIKAKETQLLAFVQLAILKLIEESK